MLNIISENFEYHQLFTSLIRYILVNHHLVFLYGVEECLQLKHGQGDELATHGEGAELHDGYAVDVEERQQAHQYVFPGTVPQRPSEMMHHAGQQIISVNRVFKMLTFLFLNQTLW